MIRVVSIENEELDSTYRVDSVSGVMGLILESWGPKDRNPEYGKAFESIISRLRNKNINSIKVYVISRNLTRAYPNLEDRAIKINDSRLIDISSGLPKEVRKRIGKEVGKLRESMRVRSCLLPDPHNRQISCFVAGSIYYEIAV